MVVVGLEGEEGSFSSGIQVTKRSSHSKQYLE